MKHTTLALAALIGIAAPALAQTAPATAVKADLNLAAQPRAEYPYMALRSEQSGSCKLAVDVANGEVTAARVLSCTSGMFRNEARRTAATLKFAPNVSQANAEVEIRWTMDAPPAERTVLTAAR
jgi:outer membrane biosynthesis protein TonB